MKDALLVQLNVHLKELAGVVKRCKPLWDAFCSCYPAANRNRLQQAETDTAGVTTLMALEEQVKSRYDAALQLHRVVKGGLLNVRSAPVIFSLNETLSASFWARWPNNPRSSYTEAYNCTVPVSVAAEQRCVLRELSTSATEELTSTGPHACIDQALLARLPILTLGGVIGKQLQCQAGVLSISYDTWEQPPNDHWSPLHDQFVLAAWDTYLTTAGQRSTAAS
jgi:hypothetical protein